MFHGQTIDYQGYIRLGAFFTNLAEGPTAAGLRSFAAVASTEISTDGVDKEKFSLQPVTCAAFVRAAAAMRRK
ncbi:MAG: hypothetical protein KY442_13745 [Proteobacteria bacterium]|nr:hypothetical protein [Pseudomonadota bacterium]